MVCWTRPWLRRVITVVAAIVMEMQGERAAVGFAEDMHDRGVVGASKGNRRREHAKGVGHDHKGRAPTFEVLRQTASHGLGHRPIGDRRQEAGILGKRFTRISALRMQSL